MPQAELFQSLKLWHIDFCAHDVLLFSSDGVAAESRRSQSMDTGRLDLRLTAFGTIIVGAKGSIVAAQGFDPQPVMNIAIGDISNDHR